MPADINLCESPTCQSAVFEYLLSARPSSPTFSAVILHYGPAFQPIQPVPGPQGWTADSHLTLFPTCGSSTLSPLTVYVTPFFPRLHLKFTGCVSQISPLNLELIAFCFSFDSLLCGFSKSFICPWHWTDNHLQEVRMCLDSWLCSPSTSIVWVHGTIWAVELFCFCI